MKQMNQNNLWSKEIFLRGKKISSRFFFAPINTGYCSYNSPHAKLIKFHNENSGKGIGISYVGNVAIGEEYLSNLGTAIFKENDRKVWEEINRVIKANGSLAGVQLGCKFSELEAMREFNNESANDYIEKTRLEIKNMSTNQIDNIINKFVDSVNYAITVGFDVVQIHAAHGYFLSQMISESFNLRTDEYGRDKLYIIKRLVETIRKLNKDIILDIRISVIEGIKSRDNELKYKIRILKELSNLNIDIISISHGIYNIDKSLIYPSKNKELSLNTDEMRDICSINGHKLWNFAGVTWSLLEIIEETFPSNISFCIGRGILADSLYVDKLLKGKSYDIKECIDCCGCHYYSNGQRELHVKCVG